ncbi:MAG TPA: hypothetical protein VIK18_09690 [Pirellulales bacterium]
MRQSQARCALKRPTLGITLLTFFVVAPACNRNKPEEPGSIVAATELTGSDVLPHADGKIHRGRSYIYCATYQLVWGELRKQLSGARVRLTGNPPLATELNEHAFDSAHLSPTDYLAMAGRVDEGIVAKIRTALGTRFPRATLPVPEPPARGLYLYSYLSKQMPFAERFDRIAPIEFRSGGGRFKVAAFGIDRFYSSSKRGQAIKEQVAILSYRSEDDFILRLNTTANEDQLLLAKISPESTLAETVAKVENRLKQVAAEQPIKFPRAEKYLYQPIDEESLKIPILSLAVDRAYDELTDRPIENRELAGLPISVARQVIRFHLDERGAQLESNAWDAVKSVQTDRPRQLVFDKPFLLYLKQAGEHSPYFALWVDSADLLRRQ